MSIFSTPTSAPHAVAKPQHGQYARNIIVHDLTDLGGTKTLVGTYGKQNAQTANQLDGLVITNHNGDIIAATITNAQSFNKFLVRHGHPHLGKFFGGFEYVGSAPPSCCKESWPEFGTKIYSVFQKYTWIATYQSGMVKNGIGQLFGCVTQFFEANDKTRSFVFSLTLHELHLDKDASDEARDFIEGRDDPLPCLSSSSPLSKKSSSPLKNTLCHAYHWLSTPSATPLIGSQARPLSRK